jgi:hypothetical protein
MDRDHVEFADYFKVLAHRKWLIVAGLIAGAAFAVVADALRRPEFLVAAKLETTGLDADALKRATADLDGSQYSHGSDRERLGAATTTSGAIELAFRTKHPQDAATTLTGIVARVRDGLERAAHAKARQDASAREALTIKVRALEREQQFLQKRTAALQQGIEKLRSLRDQSRRSERDSAALIVFLLSDDISNNEEQLNAAQQRLEITLPAELSDVQRQLHDMDANAIPPPTVRLASGPRVPGARLDRPLRAVPVGMVLGLWGAVLLVFVLEYAQRWHRTTAHESVT